MKNAQNNVYESMLPYGRTVRILADDDGTPFGIR